jgi:ParB family chromosome partitioning protein
VSSAQIKKVAASADQEVTTGDQTEANASSGAMREKRIESWPIANLSDHPDQAKMFHDLDGPEFDAFVTSIKRDGLYTPIWVTPAGVIIDGHQRVRAARKLGWPAIKAWVRDDLAGDKDAIARAHLDANQNRRQLGPLDKARTLKRQMELDRKRERRPLTAKETLEWRDRVGQRMGMSGRHAGRLLNIVTCPMPIQKAVSDGKIMYERADKVSRLPRPIQEQIARAITDGADPAETVDKHLPKKEVKVSVSKEFPQFMDKLSGAIDLFESRENEIHFSDYSLRGWIAILDRCGKWCARMVPDLEARAERSEEALRAMHEEYPHLKELDRQMKEVLDRVHETNS